MKLLKNAARTGGGGGAGGGGGGGKSESGSGRSFPGVYSTSLLLLLHGMLFGAAKCKQLEQEGQERGAKCMLVLLVVELSNKQAALGNPFLPLLFQLDLWPIRTSRPLHVACWLLPLQGTFIVSQ